MVLVGPALSLSNSKFDLEKTYKQLAVVPPLAFCLAALAHNPISIGLAAESPIRWLETSRPVKESGGIGPQLLGPKVVAGAVAEIFLGFKMGARRPPVSFVSSGGRPQNCLGPMRVPASGQGQTEGVCNYEGGLNPFAEVHTAGLVRPAWLGSQTPWFVSFVWRVKRRGGSQTER